MISDARESPTKIPSGLAGLFERAGVYFLTFDLDGHVVDGNTTWFERFGRSLPDGGHIPLVSVVAPDDRSEVLDIFARLRGGETVTGVELCLAADGEAPFTVNGMISPVLDDGAVASAFGVLREQAPSDFSSPEDAHPHFDRQLIDGLVEFAPSGMMVTDEHCEVRAWNRNFLELWGLDVSVVRSGNALSAAARIIVDSDDFNRKMESLTADRERTAHGMLRLTDGRVIDWCSTSIWDRRGGFIGRAWYFNDSTLGVHIQEGLQRSEELYRQLAASFPDGLVMIFDENLSFVIVDGAALADFGVAREGLEGRNVRDVLPCRIFRQVEPAMRASLSGERASFDVKFFRRIFNVTAVPLRFEDSVGGRHGMVIAREITSQRHLQDQLSDAEARLRALVEQIPMVTYVQQVRSTGNETIYISPQVEHVFGYSPEQLLDGSVDWADTVHPDDRRMVIEATEAANLASGTFAMEYRAVTRDGDVRWVRDEAHIISSDAGSGLLWQGVLTDITQERRLNEALAKSEALFRSAFDDAAIGIVLVGLDGKLMRVNTAFCKLIGYASDEILEAGAMRAFTYPDDLERDVALFRRFRRGDVDSYQSIKRFVHRDGHVVWTQMDVAYSYSADGEREFIVTHVQDISEQHRLEEELRRSEAVFRSAFDHAAIGMARVAPDGRWLDANMSLCYMLGYSRDELMRMDFQKITHPDDIEEDLGLVRRVLEGSISSYTIQKRYFHKNGGIVWGDLSVSLVRDSAGRPLFFISQIQDITQRKHLESRLEYLAHHDSLTGLLNRYGLTEQYGLALDRDASSSVGILMLDMNGFKAINDSYGHAAGDDVLREVARRVAACLREDDTVARVGGDEFVIVLQEPVDREIAERIAARVEAAVAEPIVLPSNGQQVHTSVSIGIEVGVASETDTDLFRAADDAMYRAKRERRAVASD